MDVITCPRCGSNDVVNIGKFNPEDKNDVMKCLDCEKEWTE